MGGCVCLRAARGGANTGREKEREQRLWKRGYGKDTVEERLWKRWVGHGWLGGDGDT